MPGLSCVAFLFDPERPDLQVYERAAREATKTLRLEARLVGVHGESDFDAAFATIVAERPEALFIGADALLLLHGERVTGFAAKHRLPTIASVSKIARGRLASPFTAREVYRTEWTGLTEPRVIQRALECLEELDWIRPEAVRARAGGRPTVRFRVNPWVLRRA